MANQTGTKTPERINKKLEEMVSLSIGFEYDKEFEGLSKHMKKQWNMLAKSIDKTCETIQKHFNGKDYLNIKD